MPMQYSCSVESVKKEPMEKTLSDEKPAELHLKVVTENINSAKIQKFLKMVTNEAILSWKAPEPLKAAELPQNSVPVYIAVKAKKHRITCTGQAPKVEVSRCDYLTTKDGKVNLDFTIVKNDEQTVIESVDAQFPQDEHRFFFQPSFESHTSQSDQMVTGTVVHLGFTTEEMEIIRKKVSFVNTKGPKYIVLIVVADDSSYEDLSVHLEAPEALETEDQKPNIMPIPFEKFFAGESVKFIAPRMQLAKKRSHEGSEEDRKECKAKKMIKKNI